MVPTEACSGDQIRTHQTWRMPFRPGGVDTQAFPGCRGPNYRPRRAYTPHRQAVGWPPAGTAPHAPPHHPHMPHHWTTATHTPARCPPRVPPHPITDWTQTVGYYHHALRGLPTGLDMNSHWVHAPHTTHFGLHSQLKHHYTPHTQPTPRTTLAPCPYTPHYYLGWDCMPPPPGLHCHAALHSQHATTLHTHPPPPITPHTQGWTLPLFPALYYLSCATPLPHRLLYTRLLHDILQFEHCTVPRYTFPIGPITDHSSQPHGTLLHTHFCPIHPLGPTASAPGPAPGWGQLGAPRAGVGR